MTEMMLADVRVPGPWKLVLWGGPDHRFWYIYNDQTHTFKKVGRISHGRGVNYHDRAVELACQRNQEVQNA